MSVEFAEPIGQRTLISSPKFCTIFDAHGEPQDVGICFTVSACIALSDKIKCHPTSSFYLIGNQDNYATYLSKHPEVLNRRADLEKSATLLAYLLSKLINEQGRIFCWLHEKLRAGWKENLKNLSEHALLLGTSE